MLRKKHVSHRTSWSRGPPQHATPAAAHMRQHRKIELTNMAAGQRKGSEQVEYNKHGAPK